MGGISQRVSASWGVFASARSRAEALGSTVQSCSEAAVAAVGEADVRLFDSPLQTSSVGVSIDHSASVCMQVQVLVCLSQATVYMSQVHYTLFVYTYMSVLYIIRVYLYVPE